jgi:hypothetical protein
MNGLLYNISFNLIGAFLGTLSIWMTVMYKRKKEANLRKEYLKKHYRPDDEIEFICSGFDFFDHDEKRYDPSLIRIEIQEKRVFYDFNRTIEENRESGFLKEIIQIIENNYADKIADPMSFLQSIIDDPPVVHEETKTIQYGISSISRGREDLHGIGRLEASALYMSWQEIDTATALLIDHIYLKLRQYNENALRLKSRELKFGVDQLEEIPQLATLSVFLTTIKISGFLVWKKTAEKKLNLIFAQEEDNELTYSFDFIVNKPFEKEQNYEMLIEQRIRQSHNSLLQDKELDIAITDICFDYTNGFHLKLLSYVGFSANQIELGDTLQSFTSEYTELRNHLV